MRVKFLDKGREEFVILTPVRSMVEEAKRARVGLKDRKKRTEK